MDGLGSEQMMAEPGWAAERTDSGWASHDKPNGWLKRKGQNDLKGSAMARMMSLL